MLIAARLKKLIKVEMSVCKCLLVLTTFLVFTSAFEEDVSLRDGTTKQKMKIAKSDHIHLDIKPVSEAVYSCKDKPNGNLVVPFPTDCNHFYTCANNETYRIECPEMKAKTYYNPLKRICSENVEPDFCMKYAEEHRDEIVEETGIVGPLQLSEEAKDPDASEQDGQIRNNESSGGIETRNSEKSEL